MSPQQSTLGQLAVPCITVKRQSQRQWLFKARHGNSSGLSASGRQPPPHGNGRQWLGQHAGQSRELGRAQVTVWVLQVGTAQRESPLDTTDPAESPRHVRHRTNFSAKHHPHVRGFTRCWEPSLAWESPDAPSRSWECSPWLWRVCCSPCRAGTGTGAAQGMGSSPGSPWDRPWLVLLLLRLCLALVQAFFLESCVSEDAVSVMVSQTSP